MAEVPKTVLTRWKLILPGGLDAKEFSEDLPREPGYDRLKALLSSTFPDGRFEHVSVWASYYQDATNKPLDMFVDDEGLLKGLPRNEEATTMYRRATMSGKTGVAAPRDPEELSFIAGPAVLFSRRVWF